MSFIDRNDPDPDPEVESAREQIFRLLTLRIGEEISHDAFTSRLERLFNLELEKNELSAVELEALAELFDRVIWYSPFPEERLSIPNNIGEVEVDAAVARARAKLAIASSAT